MEAKIKKITEWSLRICLACTALPIVFLMIGGIASISVYQWCTGNYAVFENLFVAVFGEIAWLGVLILACGILAG